MSQQKQNAGESLFAGVEQLVHQILFVADIAGQQIRDEHVGKRVFAVKSIQHRFLFYPQKFAIAHGHRGAHAQKLTCQ
jgi:hypothetical protein